MTTTDMLDRLARDVAAVVPDVDAEVSHGRYGDGIGGFAEPKQIEFVADRLDERDTPYHAIETEVPYPNDTQRCDIVLETDTGRLPIEAKLLRFNRANGDIEPTTYDSIFNPLDGSLVADATKLATSEFDTPGGLLGLYYERGDEEAPVFDPHRLAEKLADDAAFWFDLTVEPAAVVEFTGLRHDIHRQGAVVVWDIAD
ncbi:transcriptional regulator [Halorarius halobius]|uniref:transcriptional regulator n=1 Tax=Halorarius halobius TaxID=2962671 RepID=UPI0020CEB3DE|nr:transcriptional regulator [Halorarius halobius]